MSQISKSSILSSQLTTLSTFFDPRPVLKQDFFDRRSLGTEYFFDNSKLDPPEPIYKLETKTPDETPIRTRVPTVSQRLSNNDGPVSFNNEYYMDKGYIYLNNNYPHTTKIKVKGDRGFLINNIIVSFDDIYHYTTIDGKELNASGLSIKGSIYLHHKPTNSIFMCDSTGRSIFLLKLHLQESDCEAHEYFTQQKILDTDEIGSIAISDDYMAIYLEELNQIDLFRITWDQMDDNDAPIIEKCATFEEQADVKTLYIDRISLCILKKDETLVEINPESKDLSNVKTTQDVEKIGSKIIKKGTRNDVLVGVRENYQIIKTSEGEICFENYSDL